MANNKLVLKDLTAAEIFGRNFAGAAVGSWPAGRRSFCVYIREDLAQALANDGWNVKMSTSDNPNEPSKYFLPVDVSFKNFPPKIVLVDKHKKVILSEAAVGTVDKIQIESADIRISPYNWTVNGKTGIKAYLETAFFVLVEDEFEEKYANIPYDYEETSSVMSSGRHSDVPVEVYED